MSITWTWAVQERPSLRDEVRSSADGCLIVGPAGVGKTTLARQALDASDRPSVVVRGIEGLASVPFAALNAARAEQGSDDLDRDDDVVRRLRSWLSRLAADGVWILVDDADALDPPSSGLLSYAAQTEDLHLLVTMRTGHHLPNDLDRVALHRSWSTIAIDPWTITELSDALSSTLGGPVSLDLAHAVHDLSGGIPLVARELVFDGVANDRIRFDGQTWAGSPSVGSPESAARLIGRRLPSGGPSLAILQMLAIAGQLRPEMLDLIASEEALIELDAQGLLEYGSGGTLSYVRLAHPMVADALRGGLDAGERRQHLATLVEASASVANPDELDVLQTLHWAIEVGHPLPAAELRDGSALALRHMDYALAADIAGEQQRLEPSAQAAFVHAVALARAGRFEEALEIADEARSIAVEPDEVVALARILVRLHSPFGRTLGHVDGRPELAAEVAAWADERLGGRAFATILESYTTFVDGDLAGAVELAARVAADDAVASGAVREADEHLMLIAPLCGRFDLARVSQARLSSTARGSLHLPALMGADGATASLLMYDGHLHDALVVDQAAFARAERVLAYDEMMNAAAQRGIRSYLMGDLHHTVEALELSLRYRVVPSSRSLLVHGILAAARARRGELATAVRTLEQADLERETFSSILLNLDYDHLSTFVRAAAGVLDLDEAAVQLHRIAAEADAFGYQWLHTNTRLSIVRLGVVRPEDASALADVAATIDAPLIRAVAGLVVAAAEADVDGLLRLADALAAMGAHSIEVDAMTAAAMLADEADADQVRSRLERAVAACSGLVLPSGPTAPDQLQLTDREAEIARLASDGKASKEIAGQLGLSSRTVDNTLRRVYSKLGIAGRRELRAALRR